MKPNCRLSLIILLQLLMLNLTGVSARSVGNYTLFRRHYGPLLHANVRWPKSDVYILVVMQYAYLKPLSYVLLYLLILAKPSDLDISS